MTPRSRRLPSVLCAVMLLGAAIARAAIDPNPASDGERHDVQAQLQYIKSIDVHRFDAVAAAENRQALAASIAQCSARGEELADACSRALDQYDRLRTAMEDQIRKCLKRSDECPRRDDKVAEMNQADIVRYCGLFPERCRQNALLSQNRDPEKTRSSWAKKIRTASAVPGVLTLPTGRVRAPGGAGQPPQPIDPADPRTR